MGFAGYLIKIGSFDTFFNKYISAESYSTAKKVFDIDSYRDANGVLHRNALDHLSYTISFNLTPMSSDGVEEFMAAIRQNFTSALERKVTVTFFVPENNDYVTAEFYMPDIEFSINHIDANTIVPVIYYDETPIKFIGY